MLRGFLKFLFGRPAAPKAPPAPPVVPLPNQLPNQTRPGVPWNPQHSNEDMTLIDPVAKDIWAADKATKKDAPPPPPAGPKAD
jgi:hypothetical protein